jgi:VanZ family protein
MPALLSLLVIDPKLRKLRVACAVLMYSAVVIMGSIPGARAELGSYAPGIVLHSLAYATLSFLVFAGSTGSGARRALIAVLSVMAMGAFDELVQSFLPYRTGAVADWMIDCTAALVTSGLLWAFMPKPAHPR